MVDSCFELLNGFNGGAVVFVYKLNAFSHSLIPLSLLSLSLSPTPSLQVEALIAEHANCTMLNVSGHTPLDLACQNGHANVSYSPDTIPRKYKCTL